jgi:DNA-binding response OmpR family regulator
VLSGMAVATATARKDYYNMPHDYFSAEEPPLVLKSSHILCVDADDDSRLLLAELLYEHEVDFALTGDDAVQLAHSRAYDLYVVDPNVPGCEGVDLLRDLRLYDRKKPLVICSAAEPGRHDGVAVQGHLRKPLEAAIVRDTVTRLLRRRETAVRAERPLAGRP